MRPRVKANINAATWKTWAGSRLGPRRQHRNMDVDHLKPPKDCFSTVSTRSGRKVFWALRSMDALF